MEQHSLVDTTLQVVAAKILAHPFRVEFQISDLKNSQMELRQCVKIQQEKRQAIEIQGQDWQKVFPSLRAAERGGQSL